MTLLAKEGAVVLLTHQKEKRLEHQRGCFENQAKLHTFCNIASWHKLFYRFMLYV